MIIQVGPLTAHLGRQKHFMSNFGNLPSAYSQQISHVYERVFSADAINRSENRAALHWVDRALSQPNGELGIRNPAITQKMLAQCDAFRAEYAHLKQFAEHIRHGHKKNPEGNPYESIVHLGIGGSDFGPRLLYDVFSQERKKTSDDTPTWTLRFVANIDFHEVQKNLKGLNPKTTLVIVTSKSFTTRETLLNAHYVIEWLNQAGSEFSQEAVIAVTSSPDKALNFGVKASQILPMSVHVGGRFSVWGAVSLCIRIAFGNAHFEEFLQGGFAMDQHVLNNDVNSNLAALMAICDYLNLKHDIGLLMLSPYDSRLTLLLPYVQQLWMESLGKGVTQTNELLSKPACPVIWGGVGTNSQHTFFQMLHQAPLPCAVELVGVTQPAHNQTENHIVLLSNFLAQAQAFSEGRPNTVQTSHIELAKHLICPGGRPTTSMIIQQLNAESLGYLLAFWEHRTLALAALEHINPFDQWGVEIGKKIAHEVEGLLLNADTTSNDPITRELIQLLRTSLCT